MKTTYTFLVTGLAAQQAAATWDLFASPFLKTPKYNNNECSDKQKAGFDWSDLKDGAQNFMYGDFAFSGGWSYSSAMGKRDSLTRRTFGHKMIKNSVTKNKPASFSCDQRSSGFSITDIDVSVEFDTDLELHYTMGDGSTCKQYSSCSQSGTTLKNTQCGGAKKVDVYLGSHYKGEKKSCEIGFHHIAFDCDKSTGYVPPKPPQAPPIGGVCQGKNCDGGVCKGKNCNGGACRGKDCNGGVCQGDECTPDTPKVSTPSDIQTTAPPDNEIPEASTSSTSSSYPTGGVCQGEDCTPVSTIEVSTFSTITATAPPPTETLSIATSSSVISISTTVYSSISSTPAYTGPPNGGSSVTPLPSIVSAPPSTESYPAVPPASVDSTVVASVSSCSSVPVPFISSAAPQPSSPSSPPDSPPNVLPKCMNTWLQIDSKCKNNADTACYCTIPEFTKNVIDCVTAWGGSDEEAQKSLRYLIGICAKHVPENPKIIEDCPPYIPLSPAPAVPVGGVPGVPDVASTTVPAGQTPAPQLPVPQPPAQPLVPQPPVTTITCGSIIVTVPLVHFTTEPTVPGTDAPKPVGLVPGNAPPQTPAATTVGNGAPYPLPSSMSTKTAPVGSGTGAVRPSSTAPAEFTGAAAPFKVVPAHVFIGVALAFFAL